MALSKKEVQNAFLEAILVDYVDVPPAEEIDLVFSDRFLAFMAALIEEEKRGSWRLLSRKSRRVLVVAAILAVSMLLVACTPTWREAVSELIVSIYERFVDYRADTDVREEIETIYVFDPVPEGFVFVSKTQHNPYFVETIYQDAGGTKLILAQTTGKDILGTIDNEHGTTMVLTEKNLPILVYSSEHLSTAFWDCDGYYMFLSYFAELNNGEIERLISSISTSE